ncbi:MAG: hypothetical protein ACK4NR_10665 [Micavibrio sp.]
MLSTSGLAMPEARYTSPTGETQRIQLPGTRLQFGATHYDEAVHKGKLKCICCDAPVHFRKGSETISGDNLRGPRPHFASNRRLAHDAECTVPLRLDEERDPTEYDLTKGYRIHINTGHLKEQFNVKSRLYARRPDKKIMINDPELASREPFSVRGANDFLRLMRKENKERLRKAVIVNGDAQIEWKDFFIRHAYAQGKKKRPQEARFGYLVNRLTEFGNPMLVLMEFDMRKQEKNRMQALCAQPARINLGRDQQGNSHYVYQRAFIEGPQKGEIARLISEPGTYLLMGAVRLKTEQDARSGDVIHTLTMTLNDKNQLTSADLLRLAGLVNDKPAKSRQFALEI